MLSYMAKAKNADFSALFAPSLCRPLRCSSSPLRAASRPQPFTFAPAVGPRRLACLCAPPSRPSKPHRGRRFWPSCPLQNGQTDVAARFAWRAAALFGQGGRQIQPRPPMYPLPPPYGPRGDQNYLPANFFYFLFFLFSIHPHFIFYFSPHRLLF